ncbi:MAG: YbaB/EbfC family nucleoid-associated protein [Patescibacteria group bacterium]
MFDKLKLMKQAMDLQKKMQTIIIEHESHGIFLKINGKQEVLDVQIKDMSLLEKPSNLNYAIKEAINEAMKKIQKETATQMQGDLGGLF